MIRVVGRTFVGHARSRVEDVTKESAANLRGYIDCKLPLYHFCSGPMLGLVDEEVVALECSKRETSSVKDLRK